ncbi:MAG: glycosyl transferase family 1, partial [Chloroflexi bacterium]|nr:glycosyl transferase family 1 [Chloroflexota bacterium]
MLERIEVGTNALEEYRAFTRNGVVDEIYELASSLRGTRVAHINATANGGGVAEILRSLVPLYNDLGIETVWRVMEGSDP